MHNYFILLYSLPFWVGLGQDLGRGPTGRQQAGCGVVPTLLACLQKMAFSCSPKMCKINYMKNVQGNDHSWTFLQA